MTLIEINDIFGFSQDGLTLININIVDYLILWNKLIKF